MVELVVMHRPPQDVAEFERRYRDERIALAERIPGLTRLTLARVVGNMDGTPAAYHRVAMLDFPDAETLARGGSSLEGQEAVRHAAEIGTGGLQALILDVERDG
jgi:uncharacterized protein (TIGR02118 family)